MKTTFKERIIRWYRLFVGKHPKLRLYATVLCYVLLSIDAFLKYVTGNIRRYSFLVFALVFFFFNCSFTSAVFTGTTKTTTKEPSHPEISDPIESNIELADEIDTEEIVKQELNDENEATEETEALNGDMYSAEDLLTEFATLNQHIEETTQLTTHNEESYDRTDWRLILINKQHPIPDDYELKLGTIKGSLQCDERIITDVMNMIQAAKEDHITLVICSPYRNSERQQMLFKKKINKYTSQGLSYLEAYKLAAQAVTVPGSSEHEAGLAFDIVSNTYSSLNWGFGDTDAGKWLAEHAHEYGFICRYPKGKEYVTGIEYEPWHFRYVGRSAASKIYEEALCLEEFWDKYL